MNREAPLPSPPDPETFFSPVSVPPEPPKTRIVLPALLFLTTVLTTTAAGFWFHVSFVTDNSAQAIQRLSAALSHPLDLLYGLPFAFTILAILLAHEMGHYLTCRFYGIHATLPYVIPAPPPLNPFGTFGAVIKIKSMFSDRRQLFDVGIAGPLAGFVLLVPALFFGLEQSREFTFADPVEQTFEFGEPLLFHLVAWLAYPGEPGTSISLHPVGWAAWFGMLATSINLLPIGQLDGGHIVFALFGSTGHRIISFMTFAGLVIISLWSWPMLGYLVFSLVLLFLGFRHPRPRREFIDVGPARLWLALVGLVIFVLTFMPVPVRLVEHVGRL